LKGAGRLLRKEKAKPVKLTTKEKKAQREAQANLRAALKSVKVKKALGRVTVRKEKNGNVVGQVAFTGFKGSAGKLLLDAGRRVKAPKDAWTSVGFGFDVEGAYLPADVLKDYDRKRGSYQMFLHPQGPEKVQTQILRARDVARNMRQAGHKAPRQVIIRMTWTPKGKRP
jgi:endonuclease YncB( thermonuclease family)